MEGATDHGDEAIEARMRLSVVDGQVWVEHGSGDVAARLEWDPATVRVRLDGALVEGHACDVATGTSITAEAIDVEPTIDYVVDVARSRMEASLRVDARPGRRRRLADQPPIGVLRLRTVEEELPAPQPDVAGAMGELQRAGVTFGVDTAQVEAAVAVPLSRSSVVVATGVDAVTGRDGYLEPLVDFDLMRTTGVLAETPLVRRVPPRPGAPGRDVTGRELAVASVRDVRIRPGEGVGLDAEGILALALVDGAPWMGPEGAVEVRHELVVEAVDTISGDIAFVGSVRVLGDVGEARTVIARDELVVEGNVDRARLESGGSMRIHGSIMSSVLRAGGERAVAATIADRVLGLPRALGIVAAQARQLRDAVTSGGQELSHALSLQLVLEGKQRHLLPDLRSVSADLRAAGPAHAEAADRTGRWHRQLSTAANESLTPEQFAAILTEAGALASEVRRAIEQPADLVVSYMQACEAEATGQVTLVGAGIFNSRIVAWGGLASRQFDAVMRGGSILSHGCVNLREIGSPSGATTIVQLGSGGSLEADRACAGTVITGPGYSHRFAADRSCVRVSFDGGGSMNVDSLAA